MERLNDSRILGRARGAVLADAFGARASISMTSTPYAQHGAAIFVGLDSDVTVTEPGRVPVYGRVVVVPPDLRHVVACPGPGIGILYDPERAPHVAGYSRSRDGAFPLDGRLAKRLEGAVIAHRASLSRAEVLYGLAREAATWFENRAPSYRPDRRVAHVLRALRDPAIDRRVVVAQAGISQAHLRALFARDVGLSIRTFLLWHRLLVALEAFSRSNATSAAHSAGFADLAHFSRTCRRMLGGSPIELARKLLAS